MMIIYIIIKASDHRTPSNHTLSVTLLKLNSFRVSLQDYQDFHCCSLQLFGETINFEPAQPIGCQQPVVLRCPSTSRSCLKFVSSGDRADSEEKEKAKLHAYSVIAASPCSWALFCTKDACDSALACQTVPPFRTAEKHIT